MWSLEVIIFLNNKAQKEWEEKQRQQQIKKLRPVTSKSPYEPRKLSRRFA